MNCEVGVTGTTAGPPSATGGLSPMGVVSKTQCTIDPAPYVTDSRWVIFTIIFVLIFLFQIIIFTLYVCFRSLNGVSGPNDTMSETQMRSNLLGDGVNSPTTFPEGFTNNNEPLSSETPTEELRQTVQAQLEYYFSP